MIRILPLLALTLPLLACGARQGEICFAPDGPQAEARDCGPGLTCEMSTDGAGTTTGRCAKKETLGDGPGPGNCGSDPGTGKPIPCNDVP